MKKEWANPLVETHAASDSLDICSQSLTEPGNLVDERDLGCEKPVGGVFDEL